MGGAFPPRGLALLICLALSGTAAARSLAQPLIQPAAAAPVDPTIKVCKSIVTGLLALQFPPAGTLLCPTDQAFTRFARISGYKTWADMWGDIQADPAAWKPYLNRIISYLHSTQSVPAASVTKASLAFTTNFPLAQGNKQNAPLSFAQLKLDRVAAPGFRKTKLVVKGGTRRMEVVKEDMITTASAVVHAISRVGLPPDTFPTIRAALGQRGLQTMGRSLRRHMRTTTDKAGSKVTVIAPSNRAFWTLEVPRRQLPLAWVGNITGRDVRRVWQLERALVQYMVMPVDSSSVTAAATLDTLKQMYLAANPDANSPSFVGIPTALEVGGERQSSMYLYDDHTDTIYVVGARNAKSWPYMSAVKISTRVLTAGLSTVLIAEGSVPLPELTGVNGFDPFPG